MDDLMKTTMMLIESEQRNVELEKKIIELQRTLTHVKNYN